MGSASKEVFVLLTCEYITEREESKRIGRGRVQEKRAKRERKSWRRKKGLKGRENGRFTVGLAHIVGKWRRTWA